MHLRREVGEVGGQRRGGPQPEHRQRAAGGEQAAHLGDPVGVGELRGEPVEVVPFGVHRPLQGVPGAVLVGGVARAQLAQAAAQRGVAVVAERHGEPGHRRLADACELGHLGGGQVRRRARVPHQAVRDAALRRGEPYAVEEVEQAVRGGRTAFIHEPTLCMKTFRAQASRDRREVR